MGLVAHVGLPLVHRVQRGTNVKPTLIQRIVSAGMSTVNLFNSCIITQRAVGDKVTDIPGGSTHYILTL